MKKFYLLKLEAAAGNLALYEQSHFSVYPDEDEDKQRRETYFALKRSHDILKELVYDISNKLLTLERSY